MKVILRILVILVSIGILVVASLPPEKAPETAAPEPVESTPATQTAPSLIRDFLGGAQLDAGKQAKEVLDEVNQSREEDLERLRLE